jgi:hypothetical protein
MADIILRSAKGSNLTPSEVDSNFKNLNNAIIAAQAASGSGTVQSVAVNNLLGGVMNIEVTGNANLNPVIKFNLIGTAGYVKSGGNNSSLSIVSTIPFTETTGTVPVNRGGTGLISAGSDQTLLGSTGSALVYRAISTPNNTIIATWTSSNLSLEVNQSALNITSMTGVLPVGNGGTGYSASSRQDAINYLTNVSSASTGQILQRNSGGNVSWVTPSTATGTVTSVSLSTTGLSSVFNTSVGTPTTTPAISISLVTGTPGYLKSNGTTLGFSSTVPTSDLSGTVAIANGGTGQTTQQAAINALTGASSSTKGKALITDSSNNVVWSSSLSVGDLSLSSRRVLTSNTTLSATDYFIGIDSRTCNAIYLPPTDEVLAGKIIFIKDTTGYCTSSSCTVYAYASGEPPASLENTLVGTVIFDRNYMAVEFILLEQSGGIKNWYIKSFYRPT